MYTERLGRGMKMAEAEGAAEATNVQRVYRRLRTDILEYRLSPGTALTETDLAERYEASRTPVREALARLEQQGLVTRAGRSYQVRIYSLDEIEDIYDLREALEKMAIRLVIERDPATALRDFHAQLETYPAAMRAGDINRYNELGRQFHLTIAAHCGNPRLQAEIAKVHDQIRMFRSVEPREARSMERGLDEHLRIVRAVEARDVTLAEAEIRYHLQSARWTHRAFQAGGSINAASPMAWPPEPIPREGTNRDQHHGRR